MIAVLLMIAGGVLFLIGLFFLAVVLLEPYFSLARTLNREQNYDISWATKRVKRFLKGAKKDLVSGAIFLLVLGAVMFSLGYYIKYGPKGNDSIFSVNTQSGARVGDDEIEHRLPKGINSQGRYVTEDGTEYENYIVVTGRNISFRQEFIGSIEKFASYAPKLRSTTEIFVVDDYAVAETFHRVLELLDENGLSYKTESDGQ